MTPPAIIVTSCTGCEQQVQVSNLLEIKQLHLQWIESLPLSRYSLVNLRRTLLDEICCRYRHAAVPGMAPNTSGNEQLKPRSSRSFFPDSMLLLGQDQFQSTINEWWASNSTARVVMIHHRYGTSSQVWIMLYRGSRDGFSAKEFHDKCDEKGPTLTLVKVTSLSLYTM